MKLGNMRLLRAEARTVTGQVFITNWQRPKTVMKVVDFIGITPWRFVT